MEQIELNDEDTLTDEQEAAEFEAASKANGEWCSIHDCHYDRCPIGCLECNPDLAAAVARMDARRLEYAG